MKTHIDILMFGGNRELVIKRDGEKCVQCGISREEHKKKFKMDISVDHIDRKGSGVKIKNNAMDNLQTLCCSCHGRKDSLNAKKKYCHKDHPLSGANLYKDHKGKRNCKICKKKSFEVWLSKNRDKQISYLRSYFKNNPEKYQEYRKREKLKRRMKSKVTS